MDLYRYDQFGRPVVHRETDEQKEMREHFEFGARWGIPAPYYGPESHRRDPWDYHYDPWSIYEDRRSEQRPHWSDDDESFGMDFKMQPRHIFDPQRRYAS